MQNREREFEPEIGAPGEQVLEITAEEKEKADLWQEGEQIYSEKFAEKLEDILSHEFKSEDGKETIVLQGIWDEYSDRFSPEVFSDLSPEEQAELQKEFVQKLISQISKIPTDKWSMDFGKSIETGRMNCSNCATLMGLILEKAGFKNVEHGTPAGHAVNVVTFADGKSYFTDSRNGTFEDLDIGKNTTVEDKDGVKIYKTDKPEIFFKIIPVMPSKEGALASYLENLNAAYDREANDFSADFKELYSPEELKHIKENLLRLDRIKNLFGGKISQYYGTPEFQEEEKRVEGEISLEDRERARKNILNYINNNLSNKEKLSFLEFIFTVDNYELLGTETPEREEIINYLNSLQTEEGTWNLREVHYVPETAQALMIYSRWGVKPGKSLESFFQTIDTWEKVVAHVQKYDPENYWGGLWGYVACYNTQGKKPPWTEEFLKEAEEKFDSWVHQNHQRTHLIASLIQLHEPIPRIKKVVEIILQEQKEDGSWGDSGWNEDLPQTFFTISILREIKNQVDIPVASAIDKGLGFIRKCYKIVSNKQENYAGFTVNQNENSPKPLETAMGTAAIFNPDLYIKWIKSLISVSKDE